MVSEEKVYTPEVIQDSAFPQEQSVDSTITQVVNKDVLSSPTIKDRSFPKKIIAHETISSALNTKSKKILAEFEFTKQGAIQIGEYTNGVSGDIKISPNGIIARNKSGITTFAIDGDTGDAIFSGEIRAKDFVVSDENGLVSLSNFHSDYINVGSDTVSSSTYVDLDGVVLETENFARPIKTLILFTVTYNIAGTGNFLATCWFEIKINGVGYPHTDISGRANQNNSSIWNTATTHITLDLPSGVNTISAQAKVVLEAGSEPLYLNIVQSNLSYITLGR